MIFRVVPRHSSCCLVRPAFFSFLWRGWLGCRCPPPAIQKYPQSSTWEAEGRFGAFMISRHTPFHYVPQYFSIIFNELPRQTITLVFIVFYDAPRYSMIFQYGQWASKTDKPWYHGIPYDSTKLFDTPWYSNICGDLATDWYCTIFVEIPWYSSTRSELLKQTLTSHHDIPRCSTTFLVLFGEASLFLIFVARVARVPMPPSGDTEISPK